MDFYSITIERFMYFLLMYTPLEFVPLEIMLGVVLAIISVILFSAFVSVVSVWDKAQELLND